LDQYTLVSGDVQYLSFYLKEKDPTTGSISAYDLSSASTITFRMRRYGTTINTIEENMSIVDASSGYCRILVTVPTSGRYFSEVEVQESLQNITWTGPLYIVVEELG